MDLRLSGPTAAGVRLPAGMARAGFRALGTQAALAAPRLGADQALQARSLLARWELALSRFLPHSELSRLVARAGERRPVGPLLAAALTAALEAARASGGLYDPAPESPGAWRAIEFDLGAATARLPPALRLDLGAIARGMAVDEAAAQLAGGAPAGLVGVGEGLAVWGHPPGRGGWSLAIPTPAGGRVIVSLRRGALATASGPPGGPLWAVSVAASSCLEAEAAAAAAARLEPSAAVAFLEERALDALVVPREGRPRPVWGWPAVRVRPPEALPAPRPRPPRRPRTATERGLHSAHRAR